MGRGRTPAVIEIPREVGANSSWDSLAIAAATVSCAAVANLALAMLPSALHLPGVGFTGQPRLRKWTNLRYNGFTWE
jgi:hypothetical protein